MSDEKPKPIGSGFFSLAAGVAFLFLLVGSFCFDLRKVDPYVIFQYWLFFAAAILVIWGCVRIAKVHREPLRWEVGQSTLNFVVGVIAATVAIFTFVVPHGA
jgi:hypothetical protein